MGAAIFTVSVGLAAFGGVSFFLFMVFVSALMLREWLRIISRDQSSLRLVVITSLFTVLIVSWSYLNVIWIIAALIGITAACFIYSSDFRMFCWLLAGILFCTIYCVSVLSLRGSEIIGFYICFLIQLICSSTDTGGYIFGKTIGGPKVFPKISPNKTWAGIAGGFLFAIVIGYAVTFVFGNPWETSIFLAAFLIALASMAGDLFESYFKRQYNVKDTGTLIPGHGGVLDRLDSSVGGFAAVFALSAAGILFTQAESVLR